MGTRTGSHQLSSGLIVSGRPEQQQQQQRQHAVASRAVIYTGGDVKKSGELGKMYGIDIAGGEAVGPAPPKLPSRPASGSARSGQSSGTLGLRSTNSGPMSKKSSSSSFSGPLTPIQPTGLITSGPLSTSASSNRRSGGQQDSAPSSFHEPAYGAAVTSLGENVKLGLRVSRVAIWVFLVVAVMGLVVGAFLMAAVKKAVILVAVVGVLGAAVVVGAWNYAYKERSFWRFVRKFPDAELRGAVDGQYVKVTGVVTCGSIPLQTPIEKLDRCVYVSSEVYEYRGCGVKGEPTSESCLTNVSWGLKHSEKYVADFYISDFQSGLRALVKAGYGAKVAPFVVPCSWLQVDKKSKANCKFVNWLSGRRLWSGNEGDRTMRLKESWIREGMAVSVMGMVRRQDNVVMIVPPTEAVSTGCQWACCLVPAYVEQGLIVVCEDLPLNAIPV
ncbi:uncharacterized membrane protein At1g16860-like [Andrographis paniculata]|uniref:uncharacterized membrane protein At1g16860-like n=1 Tax=Andrographis paniculata TaxID=175694 RepID=UPI0021E6E9D1|nr:uncharacterized membrane protein At1g16860-like [Andrographis paniculata]XP_051133734.1 uncharacterized membrane protein At1g16860-like [Andrographis paniculata]